MKKPKVTETATVDDGALDLISKLPEPILIRIISLLPTEDACKTCLVSKRWQYLWTSIDSLSFVNTQRLGSETEEFVSLVDHVFAQRYSSSKVRKFHLEFRDLHRYTANFGKWLSYLVKNNVEHVFLKSDHLNMYPMPQFLCSCSSLISLDLCHSVFDKGVAISWKSLKTLKLLSVKLDEEDFVKLVSCCPALETLDLSFLDGVRRLEINKSNIKNLRLASFGLMQIDGYSVEIFAPYVQHLEISRKIYRVKYRLLNVSSVVSATLSFCDRYYENCALVQEYLQDLNHVTEITVNTWLAEVLFSLQLDGVQFPELKCKRLTLDSSITKYDLYGVASLLRISPHMEILNLELEAKDNFNCSYELSDMHKGDDIKLESWISDLAFHSLKSVNVTCSSGMCLNHKLSELLEVLLKNAMVLEKFVIISKRGRCKLCSMNCASQYASRLAAKLSGCGSSHFLTIFRESDFGD